MDDPLPPSADKLARQQQKMDRKQQRAQQREEKQARREERQLKRQRKEEGPTASAPPREEWMTAEDLFGTATSRPAAPPPQKAAPLSNVVDLSKVALPSETQEGHLEAARRKFGDAGSSWRMVKLKRTREAAAETGQNIEDVAMERYGSMEDYGLALEEEQYLGNQRGTVKSRTPASRGPSASQRFKQPSLSSSRSGSSSALPSMSNSPRPSISKPHTPRGAEDTEKRPFTPGATVLRDVVETESTAVDANTLNALRAKMLKAELSGSEEAYRKYQKLLHDAEVRQSQSQKQLSGVDSRAKMMERRAHQASSDEDPDDSLAAMVREERSGGRDQYDKTMAKMIKGDKMYGDSDAFDDRITDQNAAAISGTFDPKQNRNALHGKVDAKKHKHGRDHASCHFCPQQLRRPVVTHGVRTSLILSNREDMIDKTCYILPHDHVSSTLSLDEDVWVEIRNFMKCLLKASMSRNMGYIFAETVVSLNDKYHTMIECIPLAADDYLEARTAFGEALKEAGGEWSQHQKVIDTQKKGFLRSLPSNFPYYHVWLDGIEGGYGHIIESTSGSRRKEALHGGQNAMSSRREEHEELEDLDMEATEQFPLDFTKRVIAGIMELDPLAHRNKRILSFSENEERVKRFKAFFSPFDWTNSLDAQ